MKKRNNKGFSLVELVTVIAIMAILAGVVTIGYGILTGKQAKESRDELQSKLEMVRTQTMGKRTVTAELAEDEAGKYVLTVTSTVAQDGSDPQVSEYKLGGKSCRIYYSCSKDCTYTDGGVGIIEIDEDNSLCLEFDRGSGAMKPISTLEDGTSQYIYHIFVVERDKVYGIRIYPETGKMQVE